MSVVLILKVLSLGVYPIVEYFLGKTDHGSVVGVVLNSVLAVLKSLGITLGGGK